MTLPPKVITLAMRRAHVLLRDAERGLPTDTPAQLLVADAMRGTADAVDVLGSLGPERDAYRLAVQCAGMAATAAELCDDDAVVAAATTLRSAARVLSSSASHP